MRPALLDSLFAPLASIAGVGPKLSKLFDRLLQTPLGHSARLIDLLFHLPVEFIDRSLSQSIADAPLDRIATLRVDVEAYQPPRSRFGPHRVICSDKTGDVILAFFDPKFSLARRNLAIGDERVISGKLELYDGHRQIAGRILVLDPARAADLPAVEAVYGQTEGLANSQIGRVMRTGLQLIPRLPEWQDRSWLARQGWGNFATALANLHRPASMPGSDGANDAMQGPALARLAYDELLAGQLALLLTRARMKAVPGRATVGDGRIVGPLRASLPFSPTGAQERAIAEIDADMRQPERMLRLLQGDVGSGKTLVALLAMARAAEAGRQSVLMAPTEILARQHHQRIAPLAEACGLKCAVLTGRLRSGERRALLEDLAAGRISICFGTHAVFQADVAFHDLALAVVDEQHKFGVHQRLALGAKGGAVDLLVMTATPIPRTLTLTFFGDMDVSVLDEKPPGRQPIDTRAMPLDRLDEVVAGLARAIETGSRVYWVCPLVNESQHLEDVAAAEERAALLEVAFPGRVGLVHGKLPAAEKDWALAKFVAGTISILVATTVIEVGVDVPEANIMVIEHAERFGLAQLHQLRGRVGRGAKRSSCLLLYKSGMGEVAAARIGIMRETEDGFRIAEEDLRLRGTGDLLGTRQSGTPGFRLVRLDLHAALMPAARDDARLVLENDPELSSERGAALRLLLYLFEQDAAVRLLRAG